MGLPGLHISKLSSTTKVGDEEEKERILTITLEVWLALNLTMFCGQARRLQHSFSFPRYISHLE